MFKVFDTQSPTLLLQNGMARYRVALYRIFGEPNSERASAIQLERCNMCVCDFEIHG